METVELRIKYIVAIIESGTNAAATYKGREDFESLTSSVNPLFLKKSTILIAKTIKAVTVAPAGIVVAGVVKSATRGAFLPVTKV